MIKRLKKRLKTFLNNIKGVLVPLFCILITKLGLKKDKMSLEVIDIGAGYDLAADSVRDAMSKSKNNFATIQPHIDANPHLEQTDIIAIGIWNMDTTADIEVAWTLPTGAMITNMSAMIKKDSSYAVFPIDWANISFEIQGAIDYSGLVFRLKRKTSGDFDGASFDDATINRGYITVKYIIP